MTSPLHHRSTDTQHDQRRWRYAVTATLSSEEALRHYLDWLMDGHVVAVCAWAEEAEIVEYTPTSGVHGEGRALEAWSAESVYWFTDREAFERYEEEGAPALRSEGVTLSRQLSERGLGEISFKRVFGWSTTLSAPRSHHTQRLSQPPHTSS